MADLVFIVRPMPPASTLEGAFRIHVTTKDLESLGLKPGDLCQVSGKDGGCGVGIAWRSIDTPKNQPHPVKLTDTFRDAFGFKLGNQVTISKAGSEKVLAERVTIVDVSDNALSEQSKDDDIWKYRCGTLLGSVEAIASGVAFEAASRKGMKKRFLIEKVEPKAGDSPALFTFSDSTELVIKDEASPPTPLPPVIPQSLRISSEGIGGLTKQLEFLNKRLSRLIGELRGRRLPPQIRRNGGILLYGPEGTGKSLLLKRIAQAPWRNVLYVDQAMLGSTSSTSKTQSALRDIFGQALSTQPSLIVMDNLDIIAGSNDRDSLPSASLAPILAAELDKLKNTQVLVVAASNRPNDIDKSLRTPNRLRYEIEIPIPDLRARIAILKVLQHDSSAEAYALAERIGERTHGFVGHDLEALFENAQEHAVDRYISQLERERPQPNNAADSDATLVSAVDYAGDVETAAEEVLDIHITLADYEAALLEVRPSAMKEVFLETPKVHWRDIGGSHDMQAALSEVIDWPFKHSDVMEALNLTPQKGILFYGPPGCSKTLTAQAIATSSGLNFIAVKGAELTSMYVGESERAVREVFRKARAAAPSIIFFDEIDSIGSEREAGGSKGLNVLTTLLNEMDGIESLKGVLVLAATNKPDVLDPALLRPGRFDSLMYIGPPDEAARREIFRIRSRGVQLADVDIDSLARQTEGYSGAEVANICLEAGRRSARRYIRMKEEGVQFEGAPTVSQEDFEEAIGKAVKRITAEMVEGYVMWRDGMSR
ncbi:AAA+-type ATPase [Zalaria obscura]|uniref:AAA+-type ATPase n=1 Tax=Zalaria obscura TaxID=2024903 RepID=A0ACC3S5P5_9PEZI